MPFAIGPQHLRERPTARFRSIAALVVLGGTILAAASGVLGGGPSQRVSAQAPGLSGTLTYDRVVRSGNWYETTVTVDPAIDVQDLTVAIDDPLWRKMSVDTLAPDADSAESTNGRYAYHFGSVKAGEPFRLKLDGQIQPGMLRWQSGSIRILDKDRQLLAFPVRLTVLP